MISRSESGLVWSSHYHRSRKSNGSAETLEKTNILELLYLTTYGLLMTSTISCSDLSIPGQRCPVL